MSIKYLWLGIILIAASSICAEELLKTTTTWEGGELLYPAGEPEVTSLKLHIAEGEVTAFHCHPVPTLGYILTGDVEIETGDGRTTILRQGDSAVEVLRTVHRGRALNGPVEIIVFYAGAKAIPTTVLPENDPGHRYCDAF